MTIGQVKGDCSIVSVKKILKVDGPPMCVFKIRQHILGKDFTIEFEPKTEGVENLIKKLATATKEHERSAKRRETQHVANTTKQEAPNKKLHDPYYIGFSESRTCTIMSKLTSKLLQFYPVSNPNIILAAYSFGESYS